MLNSAPRAPTLRSLVSNPNSSCTFLWVMYGFFPLKISLTMLCKVWSHLVWCRKQDVVEFTRNIFQSCLDRPRWESHYTRTQIFCYVCCTNSIHKAIDRLVVEIVIHAAERCHTHRAFTNLLEDFYWETFQKYARTFLLKKGGETNKSWLSKEINAHTFSNARGSFETKE